MKMDVGEVFCELLSGLAIMALVLPILDLWGESSLSQSLKFVGRHTNVATLGGGLVLAYSLGLIMDAVGIAVGEWLYPKLYKRMKVKEPLAGDRKTFYEKSLPHVLEHREYEYAYLLAYTNLAIIAVPSVILWCVWMGLRCGWSCPLCIPIIFFICLEGALWKSIDFHLKQDAEITNAYTSADASKNFRGKEIGN